jgi:hypothetical protein
METITRDVKDITSPARRAIEDFLGHPLQDHERLVIQVVGQGAQGQPQTGAGLPEWCNVFAGLSEEEIDTIEKIALTRATMARPLSSP